MRTYTATTIVEARPEAVLDILTDPAACSRWAPVDFEVDGLDAQRLEAGSRARVTGRLAGRAVAFDVEVHTADAGRLALRATGPWSSIRPPARACGARSTRWSRRCPAYAMEHSRGTEITASVSVRPGRGLTGRLVAEATGALLRAGLLNTAVSRMAREAVTC